MTPSATVGYTQANGFSNRAGTTLRMAGAVAAGLLAFSGCTTQTGAGDQTSSTSQTGFIGGQSLQQVPTADRRPAPVAAGPALAGDRTVSTADYPGKVVVINVWGSWCGPCRKEAPDLASASRETARKAQFIGIDVRDYSPAPGRAFVRAFKVPYPQIYDPEGTQLIKFTELPPTGIPSTLFIDKHGRIAARAVGTITRTTLVQMINDLAAEA